MNDGLLRRLRSSVRASERGRSAPTFANCQDLVSLPPSLAVPFLLSFLPYLYSGSEARSSDLSPPLVPRPPCTHPSTPAEAIPPASLHPRTTHAEAKCPPRPKNEDAVSLAHSPRCPPHLSRRPRSRPPSLPKEPPRSTPRRYLHSVTLSSILRRP